MSNLKYHHLLEIHLLTLDLIRDMYEVSAMICMLEESRNKDFDFINSWMDSFSDQCCQFHKKYEQLDTKLKKWDPVFASIYVVPVETGTTLATSWHSHVLVSAYRYLKRLKSGAELPRYESHELLYQSVAEECSKWFFVEYNNFREVLPTLHAADESEFLLQVKHEYNRVITHISLKSDPGQSDSWNADNSQTITTTSLYQFLCERESDNFVDDLSQQSRFQFDDREDEHSLQNEIDSNLDQKNENSRNPTSLNPSEEANNHDSSKIIEDKTSQKIKTKYPKNDDVLELCRELSRCKNQGKSDIEIARDFLKYFYTDPDEIEKKAQSLLRQVRRFPHLI